MQLQYSGQAEDEFWQQKSHKHWYEPRWWGLYWNETGKYLFHQKINKRSCNNIKKKAFKIFPLLEKTSHLGVLLLQAQWELLWVLTQPLASPLPTPFTTSHSPASQRDLESHRTPARHWRNGHEQLTLYRTLSLYPLSWNSSSLFYGHSIC